MIKRVIGGFQAGADIAGVRAAKRFGIPTGGTIAKGWKTEAGPKPEYRELYGAVECTVEGYPARTAKNVMDADLTILFGDSSSSGSKATYRAFREKIGERGRDGMGIVYIRPGWLMVPLNYQQWDRGPDEIARMIEEMPHEITNIAGNRQSSKPPTATWVGMERFVEDFMADVFRALGFQEIAAS